MKKLIILLSIFLLIFTSCGINNKNSDNKNTAKSLKIGTLSIADGAVLLMAQKNEIYKKYNANVEIIEFDSAADQLKAIEAGQIDGLMTDMIVQSIINKGDKNLQTVLVSLGEDVSQGKFIISANKKSPHNSIATFEGSKVAIAEDTMMEFLLDSYCNELGIDVKKIEKVHIPSLSLRLETLLSGKDIDAAILPEPLGDFSVLKGAIPIIDDTKLNTNLSQSIIAIDKKYIDENYETVQNFVNAYCEMAKNINQNPDKYKDDIFEIARVPKEMKDSYNLPKYSEKSVTKKELFEKVQEWLVKKNLIDKANKYEDMVNPSFINK